MLRIETDTGPSAAARLLKPARALWLLHPVEIQDIPEKASKNDYEYRAYTVARVHVGVRDALSDDGWPAVLGTILNTVEGRGWFTVDWETVERDEMVDMEIDTEDEGSYLARWLWEIPIQRYGYSNWDDSWQEENPMIVILKGLMDKEWSFDSVVDWIDNYGLRGDWYNNNQRLVWQRLETADFSGYPEPLCWLPLIVKVACNLTGDPLLDFQNYREDEPPCYFWSNPEPARQAYRQALPNIDRLQKFLQWCDGPDQMQQVIDALLGQPKVRRKPKAKQTRLNTLVEILTP